MLIAAEVSLTICLIIHFNVINLNRETMKRVAMMKRDGDS